MAKRWNRFGPAALSAMVIVGCGGGTKGASDPTTAAGEGGSGGSEGGRAEIGKPAPDLSIQALNGKGKISLAALQGKVVIVDFWATWCGPCKESFPKLEALSKKLGDRVEIIGISVDDEVGGVADFAKANGATFAIGWDERHAIAGRWGTFNTMPTTFVVDPTGKVRYVHDGYRDGEDDRMAKEVAILLDDSSPDTRVAKAEVPPAKVDEPKPETKPSQDDPEKVEAAAKGTVAAKPVARSEPSEKGAAPKKGGKGKKPARAGAKTPTATPAPKKAPKKK